MCESGILKLKCSLIKIALSVQMLLHDVQQLTVQMGAGSAGMWVLPCQTRIVESTDVYCHTAITGVPSVGIAVALAQFSARTENTPLTIALQGNAGCNSCRRPEQSAKIFPSPSVALPVAA